jgi:hypothetical protein
MPSERIDTAEPLQPPTFLDEASWEVCPHIQRWASPTLKECLQCPVLELDPIIGVSKRECRINAEQAALAMLGVVNRWASTDHIAEREGNA